MFALVPESRAEEPVTFTDPRDHVRRVLAVIRDMQQRSGFLPVADWDAIGGRLLATAERECVLALLALGERLEPSGRLS